jgi:hypothetical protein
MDYLINESLGKWQFSHLGIYSWLIPVAVVLLIRKERLDSLSKRILIFAVFSLLLEYFSTNQIILNDLFNGTNSPFYHVAVPIYFLLLVSIFYSYLLQIFRRNTIKLISLAFVLFCLGNSILGEGILSFPSFSIGVYSLLSIMLAIGYLFFLLQTMIVESLDRDPLFIVAAGVLIYFSGNFLLWIFLTYINFDRSFFYSIYNINSVLCLVLNLFLAGALLIEKEPFTADTTTQLK